MYNFRNRLETSDNVIIRRIYLSYITFQSGIWDWCVKNVKNDACDDDNIANINYELCKIRDDAVYKRAKFSG